MTLLLCSWPASSPEVEGAMHEIWTTRRMPAFNALGLSVKIHCLHKWCHIVQDQPWKGSKQQDINMGRKCLKAAPFNSGSVELSAWAEEASG